MYTPTLFEFVKKAEEGNLIPVYREFVADTDTPVSAFMKLRQAGGGKNAFLLESVAGGENIGRYSYLGIDPLEVVSTTGRTATIGENGSSRTRELEDGEDPLDLVQGMLANYRFVPVEGCDRFYGGAVGYLGYDAVRFFEDLPDDKPDDLNMPNAHFMLTDTLVIFDHVTRKMRVVANAHVTGDPQEAYWAAIERIDRLVNALQQPLQSQLRDGRSVAHIPSDPSAMRSTMTREQHREAVLKAKEYIAAGDAIQVVLSHRMSAELDVDPFDLYRGVRAINPSPYMYYLSFGENKIIGASPELLVRCEDGHVITRPIAGTRKRGSSDAEDAALEAELLADEKERAEHIMLVDLHRNDLGRVCKPGTVSVDELMKVERYSHVMHIVSNVIGELREDRDAYDVLRASFPAGTVSGAPKIRAMEIIEELEPVHRGPYAGIVGYFSFSGAMDTCITLRTMVVKDHTVHFQAGGGIVADSDPDAEYNETLMKAGAMLDAARLAEAGLR
ncbi:MAG: anthranilate synthase component I [candidate division WS1 bacterium]|jgi:anthranilate synthase component 1|nr:anthranilate synthase component I [candidate division WS1 bacterium]